MTNFLPLTLIFAGLLTAAFVRSFISSNGLLLVANKGEQTLGLIDPTAGRQIATVAEGGVTGHEVAASPDGKRAFVPIYGNSGVGMPGTDGSTLAVIDLSERKVIHTIRLWARRKAPLRRLWAERRSAVCDHGARQISNHHRPADPEDSRERSNRAG